MQAQNKFSYDCNEAYRQLMANIAREIVQFSQDFHIGVYADAVAETMHAITEVVEDHFHEEFEDYETSWGDVSYAVKEAIKDECETTLVCFIRPTVHHNKGDKVRMINRYAQQFLRGCACYNAEDESAPLVFDLMASPIALRDPATNPATVNLLEQISQQNIQSMLSVKGGAQ